ncbi:sensor domain-containing diguanylate cyclase [Lachnoclostridium pacaense]|uniref:sensor domain-containing diguanylate cyclase n=1 Tax=Enterocloster hominis (ex Hitch et al. 2024) TaxID=1917870 RepID=UPI001D10DBC4|nr:sensor domain-containing diguanylate cyclase [Lachnoclostridium pacaense]MCC2817288.1 sensor domain-containing diguanylate cyclase [Lachnoclostridium pacaense]
MLRGHLLKRWSATAVIFLSGLTVTILLAVTFMQLTNKQNHELALHTAEVYSARIERLLDGLFHKTDVLSAILIENGGRMDEETFQRLAETLDDGVGIRAIQCLPDGTVRYCYPLEDNEKVLGTSVFDDPERRADAMLAVETRSVALSGPYQLYQGGMGLVARNPVFLTDDYGSEKFWGFTVIILDLPEALEPILLSELAQGGYDYRLHCVTDTGEEMNIAGSETIPEGGIDYVIHVPNHTWTLSIVPLNGWNNRGIVAAILLAGILISLLLSVVIYQWQERTRVLKIKSDTDELTGLYNRRYLNEIIDKWCRRGREFSLFYMDLNRFKQINDTLGHHWGDILLIEAAKRIAEAMGREALIARVGGDEFAAVIPDAPQIKACHISEEQICQEFEKPFLLGDIRMTIGVSIGCVQFPQDGADYDTLMHKADERMYMEKQKLRG